LKNCRVQTKQKMHPKAKLQNATTFTGNGNHSHFCLLLVLKIKTCSYQLCKRQSADSNVLIGRYRLPADYRCVSSKGCATRANTMAWHWRPSGRPIRVTRQPTAKDTQMSVTGGTDGWWRMSLIGLSDSSSDPMWGRSPLSVLSVGQLMN